MYKNKIIITAGLLLTILACLLLLASCKTEGSDNTGTNDEWDKKLVDQVSNTFEKMYKAFNERDFYRYISFYHTGEDDQNRLKEELTLLSQQFDTTYQIKNVVAKKDENGIINATVVTHSTSTSGGTKTVISETMYYTLEEDPNTKDLYIISYSVGESDIVD